MTSNEKLIDSKHVAPIGYCNFGIKDMNIGGHLEILNFEIQNL